MCRYHVYEYLKQNKIACLSIDCEERWPTLDATGCGEHPCIVVTWKDGQTETITFEEYPSEYTVFCASSEKHGFNVVLANRNFE